jgi:signal recognition particle GTPase
LFSKTPCGRWSADLAKTFEEQGLQNVQAEEFESNEYVLILDQLNYLGLFQELISKMPPAVKEELGGLLNKAVGEVRKGVAWKVRRFTFVGQKACREV